MQNIQSTLETEQYLVTIINIVTYSKKRGTKIKR